MARKAREVSSTGVYAVTVKTNEPVFDSEEARDLFKECFERFLGDGAKGVRFLRDGAYMLVSESERGISADMKSVMTSFSRSCNKLMNTTGKIFSGRFGSVPVETSEHEAECIAYLESDEEAQVSAKEPAAAEKSERKLKKTASKPRQKKEKPEAIKGTEPEAVSEAEECGAKRWYDDIPVWML